MMLHVTSPGFIVIPVFAATGADNGLAGISLVRHDRSIAS